MRCFFLKLTNVLKQPDGLHFITNGLQNLLRSYIINGKIIKLTNYFALTRISHEFERLRNKAFQPEDVVFYFEG